MLFLEAVRCNRLTAAATDAEIEKVVRDWLRLASDRDGGRRHREARSTSAVVETPPTGAITYAGGDVSSDGSL